MTEQPDYVRDYEAPSGAVTLADSPRFGHSTDISRLVSNDEAERSDYINGLVLAASLTAICFAIAMLVFAILFCCGRRNVGFLSGAPFEVDEGYDYDNDQRNGGDSPGGRHSLNSGNGFASPPKERARSSSGNGDSGSTSSGNSCSPSGQMQLWIRITFIISGIMFILFSILMVTQGLTNVQDSVDTVNQSAVNVNTIAQEANAIIDEGLKSVQSVATTVRDRLSAELTLSAFCPANPTLDGLPEAAQVRAQADEAIEMLTLLDNFLGEQVVGIFDAIDKVGKGAQQVEDETANIDVTDWEAMLFLIPCTIVPALLVAAVIMAMFDVHLPWYNGVINWFLLPVFILMVVASALVASSMIAVGSANADFCLPGAQTTDPYLGVSPDSTVYRFLDRNGFADQANLVRQVANFYVEQCQNVDDPFVFMTAYLPQLEQAKATLKDFNDNTLVGDTLTQLANYCQRDFNEIGGLLAEMITIINSLFSSISRALELVACDRIVPVYTLAIYDGACNYSVQAQFWVFSSSVIMGAFGLLMILFRAAYKPTLYVTTERRDGDHLDEGHEVEYEMPMPRKNNSFEDESLTPNSNTRHANAY